MATKRLVIFIGVIINLLNDRRKEKKNIQQSRHKWLKNAISNEQKKIETLNNAHLILAANQPII